MRAIKYFFGTLREYFVLLGKWWIGVAITGAIPAGGQLFCYYYNQWHWQTYGEDLGLYIPLWAYIAFAAVALVFASFVAFYKVRKQRDQAKDEYSKVVEKKLSIVPLADAKKKGIEFYDSRATLASTRDILKKELQGADEVRLAWHSGVTQSNAGFFNNMECKVVSLILTDPNCNTMPELAKLTGKELEKMKGEIYTTAREAHMANIPVYFCKGSIGNSLIIVGNPDKPNSWARLDSVVPYKDYASCAGYRVERDIRIDHFKALFNHYKHLKAQSRSPNKQEKAEWKQIQKGMK
ncbi:hypothetical protein ES703_112348 [subsurface metagenome]